MMAWPPVPPETPFIYMQFRFSLAAASLFISLMHLHLLTKSLSSVHFVKSCIGLSLDNKEATQLHALLSVCEKSNRCAVPSRPQTLKEVPGPISDCVALVLLGVYRQKSYQRSLNIVPLHKEVCILHNYTYYTTVTEI